MAIVDFHNHLMPGVDDGAQTPEESLEALSAFKVDGVETVIVTPHVDGSLTTSPAQLKERLRELDRAFVALKLCAERLGGVRVERAVELSLDTPEPDISDPRLRLAGGKFFLMEFPFMTVPPQSGRAVRSLVDTGFTPVIAHPERYHGFMNTLDLAGDWRENGAYLQINGGSLLGRYGNEARKAAFELLRRGWVDYICSDYHARGAPLVAQYRSLLEEHDAAEHALTLMQTNPTRLLSGLNPIPVAPLRMENSLWGRVTAIFRS